MHKPSESRASSNVCDRLRPTGKSGTLEAAAPHSLAGPAPSPSLTPSQQPAAEARRPFEASEASAAALLSAPAAASAPTSARLELPPSAPPTSAAPPGALSEGPRGGGLSAFTPRYLSSTLSSLARFVAFGDERLRTQRAEAALSARKEHEHREQKQRLQLERRMELAKEVLAAIAAAAPALPSSPLSSQTLPSFRIVSQACRRCIPPGPHRPIHTASCTPPSSHTAPSAPLCPHGTIRASPSHRTTATLR